MPSPSRVNPAESVHIPGCRGTRRWNLESQVRLVVGTLVLRSVLRSIAAPKLRWIAASIGARLAAAAMTKTLLLESPACKAS